MIIITSRTGINRLGIHITDLWCASISNVKSRRHMGSIKKSQGWKKVKVSLQSGLSGGSLEVELVSWDCCYKLPCTVFLKIPEIHSFTVPEAWSLKSSFQQNLDSSGGPRGESYPSCLFQFLVAVASVWLVGHHSRLCFSLTSSSPQSSLCFPSLPLSSCPKDACHWI